MYDSCCRRAPCSWANINQFCRDNNIVVSLRLPRYVYEEMCLRIRRLLQGIISKRDNYIIVPMKKICVWHKLTV